MLFFMPNNFKEQKWQIGDYEFELLAAEQLLVGDSNCAIEKKRLRNDMATVDVRLVERNKAASYLEKGWQIRFERGQDKNFGTQYALGDVHLLTSGLARELYQEGITSRSAIIIDEHNFCDEKADPPKVKNESGCVTVRRRNSLVGVITLDHYEENRKGYLDSIIIGKEERRSAERKTADEQPLADQLMRLATAILLAKYGCEQITTQPASESGRSCDLNNGFRETDGKGKYMKLSLFELDPVIVAEAKKFLNRLPKGKKADEEIILALKDYLDPLINERAKEIKAEFESESRKEGRGLR